MRWPFAVAGGRLATVEQDTLDELRMNVRVLLHTPAGARPIAPQVGVEDPTFTDLDGPGLAADLMRWEPRAQVTVTVTGGSWEGERRVGVDVEHREG